MTDGPVRYQWHELWSAAVATMWMCTPQGEAGWANLHCMCIILSASTGDRASPLANIPPRERFGIQNTAIQTCGVTNFG